ncbi:membrane protein [Raphidocelis subcapitata]|uniref:Membrane protein n=1 Tax=Raphidocelis subcapitata TaxID=307507 RepID=A0A2V0NPA1_9CHLO|nr:membrane protein [Raphidocelis subcapitata]|eukprot:GBF87330.1 membrane protein [Raphidocelis subcapitata]
MYTPLREGGRQEPGGCPLGPLASFRALALVFLPSLVAFVALDFVWIKFVGAGVYSGLAPILKPQPDAGAALASWVCIVAGAYCFVLPKTGGGKPAWAVIGQGAMFGFLLYGTVDLTNCALLLNWGWRVALTDMAWGSIACSVLALTQRSLCSAFPSLGIN